MSSIITNITFLLIGIIPSIFISNHYYRKSLKSSLTPFIQFSSTPLDGLDPNIRNDLIVNYKEKEIENLFEIQYLIANTGDKAIRTPVNPLTLAIPEGSEVLDSNILYNFPEGRDIRIQSNKNRVEYIFPLLNSGDFFITKLLINGKPDEKKLVFSIVAEELPPILSTSFLPLDALVVKDKKKKLRFEKELLFAGIFFLILGLFPSILVYDNLSTLPDFHFLHLLDFISNIDLKAISILVTYFLIFIFLSLGVLFIIGSFSNFELNFSKSKNKFVVPENEELLRSRINYFFMK